VSQETDDLPDGVICLPINEALAQHGDKVRESFMQEEAQLGGKKFAALHGAGDLSGVFIFVPDGVKVERPVEVFHWLGGGESSVILPHTLIVTGIGAEISVVDHYRSTDDDSAALSLGMTDIVTGENSRVNYLSLQRLNTASRQVQLGSTKVGVGAAVKTALVNLGAAWVRNENISRMLGSGARSDMLSLNLAKGTDEIDQRTLQLHEVQNTESDLFYKNALYDQSRTIFDGLILVKPGAHNTDAFQTCRNLLGSEEAEANSMPGLEIDADQVRCSHGATAGPIDPEQLFYCGARGIPEEAARKIISFGFLHDVIERLDGDSIKDLANRELEAAFSD
jgi:Fe-S cluster assembly protein SufD